MVFCYCCVAVFLEDDGLRPFDGVRPVQIGGWFGFGRLLGVTLKKAQEGGIELCLVSAVVFTIQIRNRLIRLYNF